MVSLTKLPGEPFLIRIAFFVRIGAMQEASMAMMRSALGGIPAEVLPRNRLS